MYMFIYLYRICRDASMSRVWDFCHMCPLPFRCKFNGADQQRAAMLLATDTLQQPTWPNLAMGSRTKVVMPTRLPVKAHGDPGTTFVLR